MAEAVPTGSMLKMPSSGGGPWVGFGLLARPAGSFFCDLAALPAFRPLPKTLGFSRLWAQEPGELWPLLRLGMCSMPFAELSPFWVVLAGPGCRGLRGLPRRRGRGKCGA